MALFGKTAAQWRNEKGISGKTPSIRDFASAEELFVLINLENTNADLIRQEVPKIYSLSLTRRAQRGKPYGFPRCGLSP